MKNQNDFIYHFFLKENKILNNSLLKGHITEETGIEIYQQIEDQILLNKKNFPLKKIPRKLINKAIYYHQKQLSDGQKKDSFLNKEKLKLLFKETPSISILLKQNNIKVISDTFSIKKHEKRYFTYRSHVNNKIREEFIFLNQDMKIFLFPKRTKKILNIRIKFEKNPPKNISIYTQKKLIVSYNNPMNIFFKNIPLKSILIKTESKHVLIKFLKSKAYKELNDTL